MTELTRRSFVTLAASSAILSICGLSAAGAQVQGLEILAPSSPGSGYDQLARTIQSVLLEQKLAAGIQVQNVTGGGGTVGLAQFITSRKRGPSMLVIGFALVGGILTTKSTVNLAPLTPVARLMGEPDVIVVPRASDIQTMADLVAKLRASPAEVRWAGGSIGGIDHVLVGLIAKAAGVDPTKVNYIVHAGGSEVMASTLGRHVTAGVSGYAEFKSSVESGALRVLAISSDQRDPAINAPTLKEAGLDVALVNWRGIMGPPNMAEPDRKALVDMVAAMASSPAWKNALAQRGWQDLFLPADEFGEFLKVEQERVATVLKDVGLVK